MYDDTIDLLSTEVNGFVSDLLRPNQVVHDPVLVAHHERRAAKARFGYHAAAFHFANRPGHWRANELSGIRRYPPECYAVGHDDMGLGWPEQFVPKPTLVVACGDFAALRPRTM